MLEIKVLMLDQDGIPRAYASGEVESNNDLDDIKQVAQDMLKAYAKSKPYHVDISKFTMQIEIVD